MKNTIKWLVLVSLLLVVVMSFALISCGGGDTDTDTDQGQDGSSYTVTFVQADGTEEKVTVAAGAAATAPTLKQVDGYTVAWEDVDFSNVTSNMTVKAEKTAVEYKITYELNGGENSSENVANYTIESATVLLANPTKSGYKFLGWYSDAEFTTKVEEIAAGSKGNKTLYANWEAISYTITYVTGEGTNNPGNPATYDITSADIVFKPASTSVAGYEFAGWYSDQAFTKKLDKITAGSTGNITVYAMYDLERYDIVYNMDGGKNDKSNPTDFNKDESVVFIDPKKLGFTFKGWFTDRDFTTEVSGVNKGTTGMVTVYAKWEIITYNLEYIVPEGIATPNAGNPTSYTIETSEELLDPSNLLPGYTFEGWYADSQYENLVEEIKELYEVRRLYAKITANKYNIEYDAKGGDISDVNPINYTVENVGDNKLVVIDSTRNGYKFLGWYLNEEYTGDVVTEIPVSMLADIKLFAKWEIVTYNITYELYDGTNAESNGNTFTIDKNVTFAEATKEGTYLVGWYLDAEFTKAVTSTSGIYEDITVYARWWDKYADPTMKFDPSLVESATANEDNTRKDYGMKLFDGDISGGNLWAAGSTEWFGIMGDKLTIVFTKEIAIQKINAYVTGNYTTSKLTAYNELGEEVKSATILAQSANEKVNGIFDLEEAVMVKTITIEITGLKWTDNAQQGAYTHKIAELEILLSNPDYVAPEVVE